MDGSYVSRVSVGGVPPPAAPPPIGFEMQNVGPPQPPPQDPGRVSPVPPPAGYDNGGVPMEQPPPIGFEGAETGHVNPTFEHDPVKVQPVEVIAQPEPQPPQPHLQPIGFEDKGHDPSLATSGVGHSIAPKMPEPATNGQKQPPASSNKNVSQLQSPEESRENLNLLSKEDNDQPLIQTDPESLFFNDGKRRIDYVMAFKVGSGSNEDKRTTRRKAYEDNLKAEGLELEIEEKRSPLGKRTKIQKLLKEDNLWFVKVHAPWEVLTRYAEIMNMKMPLQDQGDYDDENDMLDNITSCWAKCPTPFDIDPDRLPEVPDYFTAAYSRDREDQFIIKDKDTFFNTAQRSLIVYQILARAVYEDVGDKKKNKFGIKKMLSSNSYVAAYPLHEGNYKSDHSLLTMGKANDRHLLYEVWAKPWVWYKFQPLDHIRRYFGEKIGIYFSWLGYYTSMLIPAAIVGLIAFFYGLGTLFDDVVSTEICDTNKAGNNTMCPLCDQRCPYWKLERSCRYSQATYLFDNPATVAFAGFMALWATVFSEMWKRRTAEIEYDWDVADFEEEETIRPEFEASVTHVKKNPINHLEEPYLSLGSRMCRYFSSLWVVLFMLCVVVAAVFGVIVYRITVSTILYGINQDTISERASTITSITAACINLCIIIILGRVYLVLAQALTNFETHRTQTEWEDSFTFKMFLFQFVNHYASLFYIAYFKGKFIGRPGDYNRSILGRRQEECDTAGCLIELCIQLAIIMVGKQTFNNFKELILPKLMNWFKSRKVTDDEKETLPRWEEDYNLAQMPDLGLFDEYLEMAIQYGFVTVFVAAFPLAPLFALLNNIIEVRLDAYKFVTQWRRPLASRAQDIGIWFGILRGMSTVAVASNACIIAFTSEFIPKLVYRYGYSTDNTMEGYINFSLSVFNTADFENASLPFPASDFGTVNTCLYRDFRDSDHKFTVQFWHVLTAKLAFIIAFILVVVFISWLISFLIPDIPRSVKLQMLREKHLSKEAILHAEATRRGDGNVRRRRPEDTRVESPLY